MVSIEFGPSFEKVLKKIKNLAVKDRIKKQVKRIIENPEVGKPMGYSRKGTRELYVAPYRLSYAWIKDEDKIVFLDLYHKDEQ